MLNSNYQILCQKIISGGQTGVDRGALDACLENNFDCGGWCPKGRQAEDGVIDPRYPLTETPENEYHYRTKQNVIDSCGTLIISPKILTGGTFLTKNFSEEFKKPLLVISPPFKNEKNFICKILDWLKKNQVKVLNVAGPRRSEWKNGDKIAYKIISALIYEINNSFSNQGTDKQNFKK